MKNKIKNLLPLLCISTLLYSCKKSDGNEQNENGCAITQSLPQEISSVFGATLSDTSKGKYIYNSSGLLEKEIYEADGTVIYECSYPDAQTVVSKSYYYSGSTPTDTIFITSKYDAGDKLLSTVMIDGADSANTTLVSCGYNNNNQLMWKMSTTRAKSSNNQIVSQDSSIYTWQGGNIVRKDSYVRGSGHLYTLYEYYPNGLGKQFFNFPTDINLSLQRQVNTITLNKDFAKKMVNYTASGAVQDSSVFYPTFDNNNRLISMKEIYTHNTGSSVHTSTDVQLYSYKCK